MLILTLDSKNRYVQIGDDIRIYLEPSPGTTYYRKVRIGIEAPKNIRIERSKVLKLKEAEKNDNVTK